MRSTLEAEPSQATNGQPEGNGEYKEMKLPPFITGVDSENGNGALAKEKMEEQVTGDALENGKKPVHKWLKKLEEVREGTKPEEASNTPELDKYKGLSAKEMGERIRKEHESYIWSVIQRELASAEEARSKADKAAIDGDEGARDLNLMLCSWGLDGVEGTMKAIDESEKIRLKLLEEQKDGQPISYEEVNGRFKAIEAWIAKRTEEEKNRDKAAK